MSLIERKYLATAHPALVKELDPALVTHEHRVEGWAAYYGNTDLGNDVILPEALAHEDGRTFTALFSHDQKEPIGTVTVHHVPGTGLKGVFTFDPNVQRAREVYSLTKSGSVSGLSIGYSVSSGGAYRKGDTRYLQRLELAEVSTVVFPMNPKARITGVKAAAREADEREARHKLEALTRDMADWTRLTAAGRRIAQYTASATGLQSELKGMVVAPEDLPRLRDRIASLRSAHDLELRLLQQYAKDPAQVGQVLRLNREIDSLQSRIHDLERILQRAEEQAARQAGPDAYIRNRPAA
jgi:HK97 family phage prohead protease